MGKINNKNQRVVALLCDECSGCPEVIIDENQVRITDDFGGKVKLTRKQFDLLKEKVKKEEL